MYLGSTPVDAYAAVTTNADGQPSSPAPKPAVETSNRPSIAPAAGGDDPIGSALPTAAGFGTISGGIRVSTSLLKDLKAYKVIVEENVNTAARDPKQAAPYRQYRTFKVNWSKGTPFFDLSNIPFCDNTYRVTVAAEGMNGSSAYINLTSQHPNGKHGPLELALTPGTLFSVILRDQRQVPRCDMEVHLAPCGASLTTRQRHDGKTNNFGNVIFEGVERGEYTLTVGNSRAPAAPPETVMVYASAAAYSMGRPRVQGKTIVVPDGEHVTVEVWSRHGMPLEDANLRAWQLEVQRFYNFQGKTDQAGRFVFENVPYGKYQISVDCSNHGRRDHKFEVTKGASTNLVTIKMPR